MDYSRRLTHLAAVSLLCALTVRPQTPNDPVFRVDVDLRQVDLVVTDAKGHHVTDLGPDDFRIFQDGRPQKLTNFSWIEVTPPPVGAQLAALQKPVSLREKISGVPTIAKTPGNDIVAAPVANPHQDDIRRTIAFVMNDHSVGVMNRIRKLIDEQLSPTDMVSIRSTLRSVVPLSHGMTEIRDSMGIFQQFSNDKRQLDAALERIPRTCDFLHTCVPDVLGAITSAIQSLRDVPGRKALVFVGGYRGSVDRVVDIANRAGVVVFVLNPSGTPMDVSADSLPGAESIVQLAKHTGGTWVLATPGADLTTDLNLVMEDLSGYYLLGYHPDRNEPDDSPAARARHRIEVKVLRPGLIVRARNTEVGGPGGAAGAPANPQGREEVLTHALFSMFTADGIHVHLDPSFLASATDPKTRRRSPVVRARLDIDSRDLTANDDDAGGKKIMLDMALAVFNRDGSQAGAKNMIFTIIVPREKVARMATLGLQYTMDVPVSNAGPYQLRAAIRDPPSGRIGSAYAFLDIPDFNKPGVSLSSLALSPGDTTAVSQSGRPAWNEFARGAEVRFSCEIFGLRTPNVEVEVRLYRGGGPVVSIPPAPVAIQSRGGDSFLMSDFRIPDDLAAGNYTMEVIAYDRQEPTKKRAAEQWVDLTVVGSAAANSAPLPPDQKLSAEDEHGFSHELRRLEDLLPGANDKGAVELQIAKTYAAGGQFAEVVRRLQKIVGADLGFDPSRDPDFARLRDTAEFETLMNEVRRQTPPVGNSVRISTLNQSDVRPESIALDLKRHVFVLGNTLKPELVRCSSDSHCAPLTAPDEGPGGYVLGIRIDNTADTIWATNNTPGAASVRCYDLETGRLLRRASLEGRHVFNDLAISSSGTVYVSDTAEGSVYKLSAAETKLERVAPQHAFTAANGIAISGDERWLYVSAWADGIDAIDLVSGAVRPMAHPDTVSVSFIDGLYATEGSLIAIQNGPMLPRIVQFALSKDRSQIVGMKVLERRNPAFDGITTGVMVRNDFYYAANPQTDRKSDAELRPLEIFKLGIASRN